MSVTYHYANLTKREWFSVDSFGGSAKAGALGRNLAARAFDLLLLGDRVASDTVQPGRWSYDSIALISDSDENWIRYHEEFADIEADVILMLYRIDGFDAIGDAAENDERLFMELSHLVVMRQALELEAHVTRKFGRHFRKRYTELLEAKRYFKPKEVAFSG